MTDKKITVLAILRAQADKVEQLKEFLESLIGPTLREAGCINYDLHRGLEDPAHFMFYEKWTVQEGCRTGFPLPDRSRGQASRE